MIKLITNLHKILERSDKKMKAKDSTKIVLSPMKVYFSSTSTRHLYSWIKKGIKFYKEWYQPVDFGNGVFAYRTFPPLWKPDYNSINHNESGIKKWEFIIKKHLPDIKGKRILDIGCSSGLYCIELARMHAKEIIGIDRNTRFNYHSSDVVPVQDVIEQALFVKKAFELIDKKKYPIKYLPYDMTKLTFKELGKFDVIFGLCVLYHAMEKTPLLIKTIAKMTDCAIIQANQVHKGELGIYSDVIYLVDQLIKAGFTSIEIDAPQKYMLPLIIAKK